MHTSLCEAASASSIILLTRNLPELSTIELTGNCNKNNKGSLCSTKCFYSCLAPAVVSLVIYNVIVMYACSNFNTGKLKQQLQVCHYRVIITIVHYNNIKNLYHI